LAADTHDHRRRESRHIMAGDRVLSRKARGVHLVTHFAKVGAIVADDSIVRPERHIEFSNRCGLVQKYRLAGVQKVQIASHHHLAARSFFRRIGRRELREWRRRRQFLIGCHQRLRMVFWVEHKMRYAPRKRWWIAAALSMMIGVLLGGELVARFGLGLGDPPLNDAYPDIEYAFRPGTYRRFGNTIRINSHHMRSGEFPARKTVANEFRVMLMGDSVVNGGVLSDQTDLASEVLGNELSSRLGPPVVVGNISAGSWGPGNLLAYARRFGLFDADVVVIVLNSGDAGDNPTGEPVVGVHPGFPDRRPWSAVGEGLTRYVLPRLMPARPPATEPAPDGLDIDPVARSMHDLEALCDMVVASNAQVIVAHFPHREELAGAMLPGHAAIAELVQSRGLRLVELAPPLAAAMAEGNDPYRPSDSIHPNALGQKILAMTLLPEILASVKTPTVD
jgi:hypothetical protein